VEVASVVLVLTEAATLGEDVAIKGAMTDVVMLVGAEEVAVATTWMMTVRVEVADRRATCDQWGLG
jgi:hypothetical protein